MNSARISTIPVEARRYQGAAAGLVTRAAASTLDALVVGVTVAGGYAGYVALRLVLEPRTFRPADPAWWWFVDAFLIGIVVYLTAGWWINGRTLGGRLMGTRMTRGDGTRVGIIRALARAVSCVVFPPGLLWCVADPKARSVQDLVLRTRVVYDWLSRSTGPPPDSPDAGLEESS